jgi:hypothetical protein
MISYSNDAHVKEKEDLDFRLLEEMKLGAEKFANNPLHQKLREERPIREQLTFVPKMLFFVMGFKDLMQLVRYESPQSKLEQSVNTHSDEDSNHWEWYLRDLVFMNGQYKNSDAVDLVSTIWDDKTVAVRDTIYTFMRYLKQYEDPAARMLMIEVLEITFDKFKESIHPVLKKADLYHQLDYFGALHQETEENHSTGISESEIAQLISLLPEDIKTEMIDIIPHLYDQMYKMTQAWAES